MKKTVFVFGSNLAGVHGAGAAKYALETQGAVWGQGIGHFGDSYAIPTKDRDIRTLPIDVIRVHVNGFIEYARNCPELTFQVTPIGCGLAGYTPKDIAPLFENAPPNCIMPAEFGGAGEPWKG